MNVQSSFPSFTNEWPLQDHLSNNTIILTWSVLSPGTNKQLMCRTVFSSGTDELPFQENLPCGTLILTQQALLPRRHEQWNVQVLSQCHQKWPFQDHLTSETILLKSSVMWQTWTSPMSPPCGLPFQDHLPSIVLFTQKSSILGDLNSNHVVSPLCRLEKCVTMYVSHEMYSWIHFTLLAYATNQISLPHHT